MILLAVESFVDPQKGHAAGAVSVLEVMLDLRWSFDEGTAPQAEGSGKRVPPL